MSGHRLAQVNVSRLLAPLDDPRLAPFVEALEPVNARADAAPGFVWRLQGEGGDATSIRAFPDPNVIVNLSVWESIEALEAFTFGDPAHRAVLRGRRAWFERHAEADTALWWIARRHAAERRGRGRAARASPPARADGVRLHVPPALRAGRSYRFVNTQSFAFACM